MKARLPSLGLATAAALLLAGCAATGDPRPAPQAAVPAREAPRTAPDSLTPAASETPAAGARTSGSGTAAEATSETKVATAAADKSQQPTSLVKPDTYTVRPGDTLALISRRPEIYGDASLWLLLYRANVGQISSVDWLCPGQVLAVPRSFGDAEARAAREEARRRAPWPPGGNATPGYLCRGGIGAPSVSARPARTKGTGEVISPVPPTAMAAAGAGPSPAGEGMNAPAAGDTRDAPRPDKPAKAVAAADAPGAGGIEAKTGGGVKGAPSAELKGGKAGTGRQGQGGRNGAASGAPAAVAGGGEALAAGTPGAGTQGAGTPAPEGPAHGATAPGASRATSDPPMAPGSATVRSGAGSAAAPAETSPIVPPAAGTQAAVPAPAAPSAATPVAPAAATTAAPAAPAGASGARANAGQDAVPPGAPPVAVGTSRLAYREAARRAYAVGDLPWAIHYYRQHLSRNPRDPDALGELGNICYRGGDLPTAAGLYYDAARILIERGNRTRASQLLLAISEGNPALANDLYARLMAYPGR